MVTKKRQPRSTRVAQPNVARTIRRKARGTNADGSSGDRPLPSEQEIFPVVGVGASAGGLEAFRKLLEGLTSKTGMAFVLIQHLDPTHESAMAELLGRHTSMTVVQAVDAMPLERDHVYVIPPNEYLSILDGVLRLSSLPIPRGPRLPIDFFLNSLATACGEHAISIILTGTGADGSIGLKAVKENGGLVIAQDPEDAAFDGMPRSAIMTGAVDLILPLAKIPTVLLQYSKHDYVRAKHQSLTAREQRETSLAEIIDFLSRTTRRRFAFYKPGTLLRRIHRRMAMRAINDIDDYLKMLREDRGEIDALVKDLLIHVTSFFRDPKAYAALVEKVIRPLVRGQSADQPIRVWVPGCSTGEEAYSIALLFLEEMAEVRREIPLQIFASDPDESTVAFARNGLYPTSIETEVSAAQLERFFIKENHGYRVASKLREPVLFSVHDMLTDAPFSRLDLISCRNVLIYLRPDMQQKVLALFHFALRDNGALFLGTSETVGNFGDRFEPVSNTQRIYRRVGRSRPQDISFPVGIAERFHTLWPRPALPAQPRRSGLADVAKRVLLETFAPASVLISAKYEPLYYFGPVDRYLRVTAGEAGRDLFTILNDGLGPELRTAIRHASLEHMPASVGGVQIKRSGESASVTLSVHPVREEGEELFLVSFTDEIKPVRRRTKAAGGPAAGEAHIIDLERDLASTREELESAIHELDASKEELATTNEEAMSVIEEFQSTNEELETSKEELQSLNEELTTLNNQLQENVDQKLKALDDLQNILNSSDVATLFLDRDLKIRFYTPASKPLFNVISSDIGRPLADLARRFTDNDLLDDAAAVMAKLAPIRREIHADDGAWYSRRILPYRTHDDRIEGVVITFTNISENKAFEREIQAARAYAEEIIDTISAPLVVLGPKMQVISANSAFYRFFGAKPQDTVGRPLADTDAHHLHVPALRSFVDRIERGTDKVENFSVEIDLPPFGHRILVLTALEIKGSAGIRGNTLVAIEDVTDRKQAERELEAAKADAERANLGKSRFLAAASHDLRQPLQTLRLLRGILEHKVTDPEALNLVKRSGQTLDSITQMLNSILNINQLEAGVVHPQVVNFPLNDLFDRLRDEFRVHTRAANLGWSVVPCGKIVTSDPHLLEQMIRNLLSNAVKYTVKGKILLGCRKHGDHLSIEIWDTGPGIPETEFATIFKEFHQATTGDVSSELNRGLGLGLWIVQRLGDLLGHAIDVRSRVGKGSVFIIDVPIGRKISEGWRKQELPATVQMPGPVGTVLVVENDPGVREALDIFLTTLGHRTAGAASGAAALDLVTNGEVKPDILIADYTLPGGQNGLDVIADLRTALRRNLPAIVLTGDISTATLRTIAQRGYPHLNKPVRSDELSALIGRLLAEHLPVIMLRPHEKLNEIDHARPTVFVVDDDRDVREALRDLLQVKGYQVEVFASGQALLGAHHPDLTGCLILDAKMPGMGGLDVLKQLKARGSSLPVLMITGQGDIATAVQAMKAGAVDFIEKPIGDSELLMIVERALDHMDSPAHSEWRAEAVRRMMGLTNRQREILGLVVAGYPNKEIAARLGINQRTVESHRAIVMKKTGAKSLADLVRLSLAAT